MWRKTACAVSGIALAFAAAHGLSSIDTQSSAANFDLRWLYPSSKADRLPTVQRPVNVDEVTAFNVPSANTTIATKGSMMPERHSIQKDFVLAGQSAQASRVKVRSIPSNPVRTVPVDEKLDTKDIKGKARLPVGCEPAFSPVTNPAMAHISSRCDA